MDVSESHFSRSIRWRRRHRSLSALKSQGQDAVSHLGISEVGISCIFLRINPQA